MARVLLHGFGGRPELWAPVAERTAGRSLAPALPGHDPAAPACTFAAAVEALAGLIQARCPRPVLLAGYSLGARLALALLAAHPALFSGALLVSASFGLPAGERAARRAEDEAWARLLEEQGMAAFFAAWDERPLFAGRGRHARAAELAALRGRHEPRALAAAMRLLGLAEMPELWGALPELGVPAVLVAGDRDPKFRALAERAAARWPEARVVLAEGTGHDVLLERPALLAELLAELGDQV